MNPEHVVAELRAFKYNGRKQASVLSEAADIISSQSENLRRQREQLARLNDKITDYKIDLAEAVRLLELARDSVEYEVKENRFNWGEHLQHKQEPAQQCLMQIDAFLAKHKEQIK